MPDPTNAQITRTLAEFMGWKPRDGSWWATETGEEVLIRDATGWSPPTNRNDLAEVLAKLTPEQRGLLMDRLARVHAELPSDADGFCFWAMTCDPAIIARAVAEVVSK
mgnify:CR=1 FL=1